MPPKAFFKGQSFALSGKFSQTHHAYEELIQKHGGEVSSTVNGAVAFLVSTEDDVKAKTHKVVAAIGRSTPIVQEGFLGCCIAANALLDHSSFVIKARPAKRPKVAAGAAKEAGPTKKKARAAAEVAKPIAVVEDRAVIEKSSLRGTAAVVQDEVSKGFVKGRLTWDVELVLNDPAKGTDRYYCMQVLASHDKDQFWAVQHWGRTGLDGRAHVDGPFASLADAKAIFRRKYRQRTGNAWGQLGSTFVETPGKYKLLAREEAGRKKASEAKSKGRWQYYLHNAIDGKAKGWYDYEEKAGENLEKFWLQYYDHPDLRLGVRVVHSDYFPYEINFTEMFQTNMKTGTRRIIRRIVEGETPSNSPPLKVPVPVKPPAIKDEPSDEELAYDDDACDEGDSEEQEDAADEGSEGESEGEDTEKGAAGCTSKGSKADAEHSDAETLVASDSMIAAALPLDD